MEKPSSCKPSTTSKTDGHKSKGTCQNNSLTNDINVRFLPKSFSPGVTDVIIGRGKKCHGHLGNKRLKHIVMSRLDEYYNAVLQSEKSQILRSIVGFIRSNHVHTNTGGFVKIDRKTNRWYDVGDNLAREKISKAFRDALIKRHKYTNEVYSSSNFMHDAIQPSIFQMDGLPQTSERNQFKYFSHCSTVISDDSESSDASYFDSPFKTDSLHLSTSFFEESQDPKSFSIQPPSKNDDTNIGSFFNKEKIMGRNLNIHFDGFNSGSEIIDTENEDDSSVLDDIDIRGLESNELRTPLHDDFFSCYSSPFMVQKNKVTMAKNEKKIIQSMTYSPNPKFIKHIFDSVDNLTVKSRSSQLNVVTSRQA